MDREAAAVACSICLDHVLDRGDRATARLRCGHEFHLDCIGSAFNAKGQMQCPNCRKVEDGQWLYATGHRSSADFDFEGWVTGDVYELENNEFQFGVQWCPFGISQLAWMLEDVVNEQTYHAHGGGGSGVSGSSLVCPYLALHGFLHPLHGPSTSSTSSTDNSSFHRHPTSLEVLQSSDIPAFHSTEPMIPHPEQQYSSNYHLSGISDQATPLYGIGLHRFDGITQQSSRPYVHPSSAFHPPPSVRRVNNFVAPQGPPAIPNMRGHSHSARRRVYHQSPHPAVETSTYPPTRRVRPRPLTITSFIAAASSTAEAVGPRGFSASGLAGRGVPDSESTARVADPSIRWAQDGYPAPSWVPADNEPSHWWGGQAVGQNQSSQAGAFLPRPTGERVMQQPRREGGYRHMPPGRMPPPYL